MKVSIVIPCHNAEPYLGEALASALDQTSPAHEIIVVDDGSTDGSVRVAEQAASRAPGRVRVVAAGFGRATLARNLGAQLATGDALLFMDADDLLAADALEGLSGTLSRGPSAIATCPWVRLVADGESWVVRPPSCTPRRPGQDALSAWLMGWYHPPCSVLWSREAFERAGRWDERALVNQDGDLVMRALAFGIPLIQGQRGLALYRRTPGPSLSGTRVTEDGLRSRIRTVLKIAWILEDAAALDAYRPALSAALAAIASDAAASGSPMRGVAGRLSRDIARRGTPLTAVLEPEWRPRASDTGSADGVRRACGLPSVTVVIPTYNRGTLLRAAIQSVLSQTYTDFELLVVDDGSTDGTGDLVRGIPDPRIRYLRQPRNLGVAAARNRGMREARGNFIAFLDSDDEWAAEKLERQVAAFDAAGPEVGLVYTGVESLYPDGTCRVASAGERGRVYREMLQRNVLHGGGSNVIIRRAVVATAGFFPEELRAIEDYEYWLRVCRFFEVEAVADPLIRYREAEAPGRRSRALDANLAARWWFYRRHRHEMRRQRVAHLFLLNTAQWVLNRGPANRAAARRLALQAVLETPASRTAHRVFWSLWTQDEPGNLPDGPRLRILMYSRVQPDHRGGVQRVIRRLAAHLEARGHTVVTGWALPPTRRHSTDVVLPPPSLIWRPLPKPRSILGALLALLRIARELARHRPHVVNFHFVTREALVFLALRGLFRYKLVLSVHGSDVLRPKNENAAALDRLIQSADGVIAVSRPTAARVRERYGAPARRVHVVPNGIDHAFWSAAGEREDAGAPLVLTVGRLHPVKGHDVLLEAFARVLRQFSRARLVIVGDGGYRAHLEQLADELGVRALVTFAGELPPDGVREQMRAARCFALPSRSEGLPLTLLEAMAAGVPVVASAVGGVPDVLSAGTGIVVPPESPAALATGIATVLADPAAARTMARAARARARTFAAAEADARYEELLLSLCDHSGDLAPQHQRFTQDAPSQVLGGD